MVAVFSTKVAMPLDSLLLASSWLEIRLTTSSCFCLQNKLPPSEHPPLDPETSQKPFYFG
jgi:hypothetical protein